MRRLAVAVLAALALWPAAAAAWPTCGADAVKAVNRVAPASFGNPAMALGLPDESTIIMGALDVVSLGVGGSITLAFTDNVIVDRPGPDFIVFENAFFCLPPTSAADSYSVFAEPVMVEASADGVNWVRHPFNAAALAEVSSLGTPRSVIEKLHGLAGITPTYGGLNIVPDDLLVWDPNGTAGVSGWGGDAFDLADFGLTTARFVRLIDAGPDMGGMASAGADIDAVIALHSEPAPPAGADSDGDGLSDREEEGWGTDPLLADTDGDGMDDGREAASCLCPLLAGDTAAGINMALMTADADHDGRSDCYPKKPAKGSGGGSGGGGGGGGCVMGAAGGDWSMIAALLLPAAALTFSRRIKRRGAEARRK